MLPFAMASPIAGAAGAAGMSAAGGSSMALPAIGGFLGGMGQFAGGMQGLFGDQGGMDAHKMQKKSKKFARQQLQRQMRSTIYWRVRDAKRSGLHPLAALGISPHSGPSATFGMDSGRGSKGRALANMGQGIQRAMAGKNELESAMAEYYRAMAKKASSTVIGGQPESLVVDKAGVLKPSSNRGYDVVPAQVNPQRAHGYVAGPSGFYNFANVPDGGVQVYPTQKFQESTSEGFHALEYGIKMSGQWAKNISLNALNTPKSMMARNQLRNEQRAVEAEYGGRYAYSPFARTWYPTNTDRLYLGKSKILGRFSRKYEYGSGRLQKSHRKPLFDRERIQNESWYFD